MGDENMIEPSKVKEAFKKAGRNDLCPCGTGKKYKMQWKELKE
jgi:uncharacterized protein YecA (UPF0149 family)